MWKIIEFFASIPSKFKNILLGLGGLVALLSFFRLWLHKRENDAVEDFKKDKILKDVEVRKDAKRVGEKERRASDGLSDSDVADRLRSRSDDWSRL